MFSAPTRARALLLVLAAGALANGPARAQPNGTPAAQTPAAAPQTGPITISVKADPKQPAWVKVCNKETESGGELCNVTRDFVTESGQPLLAIAVFATKDPKAKRDVYALRFLMPLGMQVQPGVRFNIDSQQGNTGKFSTCNTVGCFADATGFSGDIVEAIKKGTTLRIQAQNQTQREVTFLVPLAGFGKSFDGPALDPKVLADQSKKLDTEIDQRDEDLRKKSEAEGAPAGAGEAATKP
ncbi:invasion associated locus B family protein [Methylobacterium planeticum]|uniref:Invasion associated locus B family protein n=1 Tax=Methylobacterium planeticum TaxID=2615211 RepID=A0A6N6N0Z2_9HYPH|nr:invasion associated locus B family protein [Methylobacterium planeticum]KAB1076202.1 invasion associated locus B family protein [Methylobacterium planeticum]